MGLRGLLVVLVVLATALFVVGVIIERGPDSDHHETAPQDASAGRATGVGHGESGEAGTPGTEAGEGQHEHAESRSSGTTEASGEDLRPLGIDVEAWPFVALAVLASLALAAAAALRPRSVAVLAGFVVVLVAFAVFDVREIAHQAEEDKTGLAVLAGLVAVLHLAAAAIAGVMASRARTGGEPVGPAGTMPA